MILLSWFDSHKRSYFNYVRWLGVDVWAKLPCGFARVKVDGEIIERSSEIPWREVSGLLLTGGGDVAPARSGAPWGRDVLLPRDEWEFEAIKRALCLGIPILGICRGHQVLNVYFGGTLLNLEDEGLGEHHKKKGSSDNEHLVEVQAGTLLAEIIGPGEHLVNSAHHQAVARVGEGLRVSAWWEEEVIEALEFPEKWLLGVQWHPERLGRPKSAALREAFLKEAGL